MTSYTTVQKQQLSQLGAYLQEKRQEQGKSLEDISLQTYIRAQLLKAVENGDTSDLPQPIFVQGFIRRYADALGLDGTNFSKQFPVHSIPNTPRPVPRPATPVDTSYQTSAQNPAVQRTQNQIKPAVGAMPIKKNELEHSSVLEGVGASAKKAPEQIVSAKAEADTSKDLALDPTPMGDSELATLGLNTLENGVSTQSPDTYQSTSFDQETSSSLPDSSAPVGAMPPADTLDSDVSNGSNLSLSWLPWGIGAAVLVGAIALIGPRIIGGGSNQQPEPSEATAPPTEVTPVETSQTEASEPVTEPEPAPAVSDAPVSLQVEITEAGPSWMSVVVDGELAFEGLLDPGTTEIWEGQESITINVGNAGATLISANGSEPKPAGNPGGAEFLTFSAAE